MSACSTQRAYFEYSEFKEMPIKSEALTGSNLGMIVGEDGGAIWDNCTEKARLDLPNTPAEEEAFITYVTSLQN